MSKSRAARSDQSISAPREWASAALSVIGSKSGVAGLSVMIWMSSHSMSKTATFTVRRRSSHMDFIPTS